MLQMQSEDDILRNLMQGKNLLETGKIDEALKVFQEIQIKFEVNPPAKPQSSLKYQLYLYMSEAFRQKGDFSRVKSLCQKIISGHSVDAPILIEAYQKLGEIYRSEQKFSKATDNFAEVLKLDPSFEYVIATDIFYALGVSYSGLNQPDTALDYLEKALRSIEPERGQVEVWQIYLARARIIKAMEEGNINKWIKFYQKVAEIMAPFTKRERSWIPWSRRSLLSQEIAEDLLETYYYIGVFHVLKKENEEAIESLKRAIDVGGQQQPFLAKAYFYLGRAYLKNNDTRKARRFYNKLLNEIDPKHQWLEVELIYYDIGQSYYKEKKYKQAIKYREKILDIEDVRSKLLADTHLGLGHSYFALNSFEQAAIHYREYLRLSDPKASSRDEAMKQLVYANEALAAKK